MSEIRQAQISVSKLKPKISSICQEYRLFVTHRGKSFLAENSSIILESHQSDDGYEAVIREVSEAWLISEIFAYAGEVKVIEPTNVMAKVANIAKNRLAIG
jgi:predicted DNA-binding transcriptional regulator YafY